MTLHIAEGTAHARGQAVGHSRRRGTYTLHGRDILAVDMSRRINREQDVGTIVLDNTDGQYAGKINSGDTIRFYAGLRDKNGPITDPSFGKLGYGEGDYGALTAGSFRQFTALARNLTYDRNHPSDATLTVKLSDFVSTILSWRETTGGYTDRPLSINERNPPDEYEPHDGVLNHLLAEEAPEINRSSLMTIEHEITVEHHADNLLEAIYDLGQRAETIIWGVDDRLYAVPLDEIILRTRFLGPGFGQSPYGADPGDVIGYTGRFGELYGSEYGSAELRDDPIKSPYGGERSITDLTIEPYDTTGELTVDIDDSGLMNRVRVNGGDAVALDVEQPHVDEYVTVDEESRMMTLVPVRKAQAKQIEIWTRNTGDGALTVRIQKDAGGQPVDVENDNSDISRHSLDHHFLSNDDWTTFIMPNHRYHVPEIWLIVESRAGEQVVGVGYPDGDPSGGTQHLAYRVHYPYPLTALVNRFASQQIHRRRDETHHDNHLVERSDVAAEARRRVNNSAWPDEFVQFEAASPRAHALAPGMSFIIDRPNDGLDNQVCIITDVESMYENHQRRTYIEGQTAESYLGREIDHAN